MSEEIRETKARFYVKDRELRIQIEYPADARRYFEPSKRQPYVWLEPIGKGSVEEMGTLVRCSQEFRAVAVAPDEAGAGRHEPIGLLDEACEDLETALMRCECPAEREMYLRGLIDAAFRELRRNV